MTSLLKSPKRTAKSPRRLGLHPQPDGNIGFFDTFAVLGYCGKAHPDDAFVFGNFGDEIGPDRVRTVVKDHDPFVSISFDFSDSAHSQSFSRASS